MFGLGTGELVAVGGGPVGNQGEMYERLGIDEEEGERNKVVIAK